MEVQVRRNLTDNQENLGALNVKASKGKKQGPTVRGALGDLNSNVLTQREINSSKVAGVAAEFEKKASICRVGVKSYNHVQPKVDTGLASKSVVQQSSRPPLRREESTAGFATRAIARSRAALKDTTKATEVKESSVNIYVRAKKKESKTTEKLPTLKEEKDKALKPILKEPIYSLGKLKIGEKNTIVTKPLQSQNQSPFEQILNTIPELPADIEDIDAGDDNPLIMSVYIKEIYAYLIHLEEKYPIEPDHLKCQTVITGKMRATLIDWLVDVHHQFSLLLETFHLAVAIVDRYLQAVPNVQRAQLQLVGVTAMYIASKYEEIYAPDVGDFVYVTDMAYSKADLFQCERDILLKLNFCLGRPIPLSFLRRFVKAAHGTSKNHHLAKYLVDLSLIEYSMSHYRPSELAAAAICLSLFLLSNKQLESVWTPTLAYYSGYNLQHIEPIISKIAKIVVNIENSKHKAVYNKYLDRSLAKVSSLPQLKSKVIYELAKISPPPTPNN